MYDYVGSITFKKDELKALAAAGAKVSADVTQAVKLNYRNHRKIAVIDGEIGYTGGMNMGQEYIDGGLRFATWRDTHLRLTGQAVAELQKLFAMRWFEDEHEDLLTDEYLPAPDGEAEPANGGTANGDVLTQVVAHTIEDPWEAGRRAHLMAISGARRTPAHPVAVLRPRPVDLRRPAQRRAGRGGRALHDDRQGRQAPAVLGGAHLLRAAPARPGRTSTSTRPASSTPRPSPSTRCSARSAP